MSDIALDPDPAAPSPAAVSRTVVVYRTKLMVRIWHWINALSLLFMLLSGLQIFNAHPALYWGQAADFDHPILAMRAYHVGDTLRGVTFVGKSHFTTTGLFGVSKVAGHLVHRGFPSWLTLPTGQDLASGRRWHFFFAWIFAINGAVYFAYIVIGRHLRGGLWPTVAELKGVPQSIWDHLRFKHPEGEAALKFNVLQKLAYLAVLLIILPLMILTGMTMSPGMDAAFPGLLWAFGGRQSARTVHFLCAWSIVGFFLIHIFEVFAAGFFNEMRSILTGRFKVTLPAAPVEGAPS